MKTLTQIMCEIWRREPDELQLHVTLNPTIAHIETVAKEYARQERDKALDWASENVELRWDIPDGYKSAEIVIDTDSILSGKTHPDLSI